MQTRSFSLSSTLNISLFWLLAVHLLKLLPQSQLFLKKQLWLFILNSKELTDTTKVLFL